MGHKSTKLFILGAVLFFLAGCGNARQALMSGNMTGQVREPTRLRVAILPFETDRKCEPEDAEYVRRRIFSNLKGGGYNLVEPFIVSGVLERNDWSLSQAREVSPQRLGEAFGADAILYGKITSWETSYLAVHSSITIGTEMRLVDARSGEVLLEANYKKTDFDGLLKIPTGISSAVLSPILFLAKKSNKYRIADEVAREMTAYLARPEKTAPPPSFKEKVYVASAADALEEIKKWTPTEGRDASPDRKETVAAKVASPPVAPAKKETARTVPPSAARDRIYTLQVASYPEKESAAHLVKKLKGRGMDAFIAQGLVKGQRWYRVQVASFETSLEAESFAAKNLQDKKIRYFIAPYFPRSIVSL